MTWDRRDRHFHRHLALAETDAPLARKSVRELVIRDVIAAEGRAVIWFENHTPEGIVPSCDWVRVENDQIVAIQSFYDSTTVRGVLSDEEQGRLGDARY